MTKDEFLYGFQLLASVPYRTQAEINLKEVVYRRVLIRFPREVWFEVVDEECLRDNLKMGLQSPGEYYKMCQFKESELRIKGMTQKYSEPNWKGMKMFLDACVEAGNRFKGQKIEGNIRTIGMCIGIMAGDQARYYEKLGDRLEELANESAARKAKKNEGSVVQGSNSGAIEERDWADPEGGTP